MAAKAEQPMAAPRRGEFRAQSEHVEKLAAKYPGVAADLRAIKDSIRET